MKTRTLFLLAATIIISAAFFSCEEKPGVKVNEITMKTSSAKSLSVGLAGTGKVAIDWNDGTVIDTIKVSTTDTIYRHEYVSERSYSIKITGDVTFLSATYSNLIVLDVTKNTTLEKIYCSNNKLSVLDVASCKALKHLDCSDNNFSAKAINELFGTLNSSAIDKKTVEIYYNTGCQTCDREIAQKKRWIVGECM